MTAAAARHPRPVPDELSAPYWAAAAQHRLVLQRCTRSRRFVHPPAALCPCCGASDLAFEEVSGRGTIYSFVVMHDRRVAGFEDRTPYVNVWVEPQEQPGLLLLGNLVGSPPESAAIGAAVTVTFEDIAEGVSLPQFRLAP